MTEPLAIVVYENLLPGSQLANRLRDMGYRVHTLGVATDLMDFLKNEKPLVILSDISTQCESHCKVFFPDTYLPRMGSYPDSCVFGSQI